MSESENTPDFIRPISGTLGSLGTGPAPRSHTHLRIRQIIEDQGIGVAERLLLWLAKTDLYVLHIVPNNCRVMLVSLGLMVVFTSLLAFGSATYTALTMVVGPDVQMRYPIAIMIALVYAFGIMIIDREIVGATVRSALWIRFVFAICIAFVVSWPIKIKLFEGAVNQELIAMSLERNIELKQEIDELKTGATAEMERLAGERSEQRKNISGRLDSLRDEVATLDDAIAREAGLVECGPKCQRLRRDKIEVGLVADRLDAQLGALSGPIETPSRFALPITKLEKDYKDATDPDRILATNNDILSKYMALDRVERRADEDGAGFQTLSWFVLVFFMLLEMIPLALKWSLGKTEYQYYLDARSNLNIQKIVSLTNLYMAEMHRDPMAVTTTTPPEILVMIAWLMEDESRAGQPWFDPRTVKDLEAESKIWINRQQKRKHDEDGPEEPELPNNAPRPRRPGPNDTIDEAAPESR